MCTDSEPSGYIGRRRIENFAAHGTLLNLNIKKFKYKYLEEILMKSKEVIFMKNHYEYYTDNMSYMSDVSYNMYASNESAYNYTMECYNIYKDMMDKSDHYNYLKSYNNYMKYYKKYMKDNNRYMKMGGYNAMYAIYNAYKTMNTYAHQSTTKQMPKCMINSRKFTLRENTTSTVRCIST